MFENTAAIRDVMANGRQMICARKFEPFLALHTKWLPTAKQHYLLRHKKGENCYYAHLLCY